jgi:hypothetical protein
VGRAGWAREVFGHGGEDEGCSEAGFLPFVGKGAVLGMRMDAPGCGPQAGLTARGE